MAPKLLKISPDQIKRLLREVPEPDDQETTDVPHGVLEHLPAIETAVVRSVYGDAAAMDDDEFERFLGSFKLDKL